MCQIDFENFTNNIIESVLKKEIDYTTSFENVFYATLEGVARDLQAKPSFIKYLNIFNNIGKGEIGNVEFYADFIHTEETIKAGKKRITANRNEIDIRSNAFSPRNLTIGQIFRENRKFGESFEYCNCQEGHRVLNNSFFVEKRKKKREYSAELLKLVDESEENKSRFNNWLKELDTCYANPNGVTHFFLFNGPIYFGKKQQNKENELEGELSQYVINANVGVTITKDNEEVVCSFLKKFEKFIEQISFNLIVDVKDYQMRQTAVRASIAQVMARNMSHNLGSHVFSHLIKTEVYDELTDEKIKRLLTMYSSCENDKVFEYQNPRDPKSPLKNQQLGYFNQYLKSRMDYLSEVTFGVPTMLTSKMIYDDVFKELDRVRLLLNHISGISEFKYKFDFQHNGESIMEGKKPDFAAAFPSDVLGCQAFYNIIENIIRNTAKHAKRTGNDDVTFTINFKDINTAGLQGVEGVDDLYCVEIDNGIQEDKIDELVRKQKSRINESVLDEYNQLRGRSLGLLEMEASAAFLRQIDMPDIESDDYYVDDDKSFYHERNGMKRLNILKPFKTTGGALGYRFFVQKPKEFLFVGEWGINDENYKKKLRNVGIEFISEDKFCDAMKERKSFPHQFLFYKSTISKSARSYLRRDNNCKTLLPLRKLKVMARKSKDVCACWSNNLTDKQNNTAEITESDVLQNLKNYAWKLYFQSVIKDELKEKENTDILINQAFDPSSAKKNQVVFLHHGDNESYERSWSVLNSTGEAGQSIYTKQLEFKAEGWLEDLSSRTMEMLPSFRELYKGDCEEPLSNYCLNLEGEDSETIDSKSAAALRMNIFEAYHNKVIVIDERVQRFALSNDNETNAPKGKIPVNKIFESTNVLIPETKLDPTSFDENAKKELDTFVMENLENAFVLVHYGVLERMYEKTDDITKKLEEWAKKAKRVVVTSGRGSHSLPLPDSVCFANLSSVLNVFVENRNKYSINYLIHQSRRKNG